MRLVCFIIFGIWTVLSTAASYNFRNLSVREGLSDLVVNTIYKDSLGYMWFGTNTSLERFDGVYLKHFLVKGSSESLKRVYAIAGLPNNEIWVGTGNGLWRVNSLGQELERMAANVIDVPVRALLSDDDNGILYVGTEKGLYVYQDGKIRILLLDKNVFSQWNFITGLNLDPGNMLWMSTRKGVAALNLKNQSFEFYAYPQSFNNISRIGSTLYLGTMGKGIIAFDMLSKQYYDYVDVGCSVISSLSSDGKDLLYVGTDGNGVHFISVSQNEVVKSFRHEVGKDAGIRSNSVYSVLVDRDGLIWIGYYQLGLDYTLYQTNLFETYKYPPFLDTRNMLIRAIAFHGSERLIGTRDGLFFIDESRNLFRNYSSPQLRANLILSSCYLNGKYYIGTYGGGMYVLDPNTLCLYNFDSSEPDPFVNGHIFCMRADQEGNLWIGTSAGLYCYREGKRLRHYTTSNSKLPDGNVYEIFFDSTHKGWICTETGICLWEPSSQSLKINVFPEGFIHKEKIRMVYEDSHHWLYFLPEKGELFVSDLNMNRFNRVSHELLNGKSLMSIVEDEKGWLWVTTSNGMYRYDKKETCIPYNFTDGIPSQIFINCFSVKDEKGHLWFGNSKGLLYLDMNKVNNLRKYSYKPAVSDVQIAGKESVGCYDGNNKLSLKEGENSLTFRLSSFTYTDPLNMAYQYFLEGKSKEWVSLQGTSEVSFYNLPPGTYQFKVRHIGYPDTENSLEIVIPGGWYGKILWGIVLLFLFIGAGYVYLKFDRRKKKMLETVVETPIPEQILSVDNIVKIPEKKNVAKVSESKYRTNKVSPEECKRLFKLLEHEMKKNKPYKSPEFKIADLAELIGTSSHVLSYLFNQYLNCNFYDYVNDYRINEFKILIMEEEYSRYTLSALAEVCGFSSRASFFRYFKKVMGVTPNEYVKYLRRKAD